MPVVGRTDALSPMSTPITPDSRKTSRPTLEVLPRRGRHCVERISPSYAGAAYLSWSSVEV